MDSGTRTKAIATYWAGCTCNHPAGILGAAPTGSPHPFLSAVHAVAGSVSDLRDIVLGTRSDIQDLRTRLSALESSPTPSSFTPAAPHQLAISQPQPALPPPSAPPLLEPPSSTPAPLNPAAPSFTPPAPMQQQPVFPPPPTLIQTNQLKLTCLPGYSLRGPSTVFLCSELHRVGLTVPQFAALNWVSKDHPWRILTISFPDISQAGGYLTAALRVLQQLGPSAAWFSIDYFQPSAQYQAQQRGARNTRMLADGAQQARGPIAAALELVDGWTRADAAPEAEAVQQLAGMLRSVT